MTQPEYGEEIIWYGVVKIALLLLQWQTTRYALPSVPMKAVGVHLMTNVSHAATFDLTASVSITVKELLVSTQVHQGNAAIATLNVKTTALET